MAGAPQFGGSGYKSQTKNAQNVENSVGNSQVDFMNTLQQDFGTAFAGQQNILNGLTKSLQTTLSGGPSQFGFSSPELTALNTLATSGNAQQYQNARAAAGEAAATSGGSANLPTGSQSAIDARIAQQAAQTQSNELLGIQEAGYRQGTANYNEAVSGLNSAASIENPNGLAGSANNAGESAFGTASNLYKQAQANNPWPAVGGLAGSLAGAFLGPMGASLGGTLGGAIGGAASGGSPFSAPQLGNLDMGSAPGDFSQFQASNMLGPQGLPNMNIFGP